MTELEKKVREILEDFLRKHYKDGLTSCVNIPYEDEATHSILSLIEEEKDEHCCKCGLYITHGGQMKEKIKL